MPPKITFITPTFNANTAISDTIQSVEKEASRFTFEHFFIDGGSQDGTIDTIRSMKGNNALVFSEPDSGVYDAMNKGIRRAAGEWIAIINADDYYLPGAVETVMAAAAESPSVGIIHGDMIVDYGQNQSRVCPADGWTGRFGLRHPICHPAMFARSEVYKRLGLYETNYRLAADQEFFFRALDGGERLKYIPESLALMRAGGLSTKYYDAGTLELLEIHRARKGIIGLLSHVMFYKQTRLRNHPKSLPGWRYVAWAARDFVRGKKKLR